VNKQKIANEVENETNSEYLLSQGYDGGFGYVEDGVSESCVDFYDESEPVP